MAQPKILSLWQKGFLISTHPKISRGRSVRAEGGRAFLPYICNGRLSVVFQPPGHYRAKSRPAAVPGLSHRSQSSASQSTVTGRSHHPALCRQSRRMPPSEHSQGTCAPWISRSLGSAKDGCVSWYVSSCLPSRQMTHLHFGGDLGGCRSQE